MLENINARKYLEHDSIQKSGKKDMVVTVLDKALRYTSDLLPPKGTIQSF